MNYSKKGQGALEYLLMIGAAILVVAVVIIAISGTIFEAKDQNSENYYSDKLNDLKDFQDKFGKGNNLEQFILVGVDGVQYYHYKEMYDAGKLPNFRRLVGSSGFNGTATITGHQKTETNPGNAELNTGLGEVITGINDNSDTIALADGLTTFERIDATRSDVVLGLIYGKNKAYVPHKQLDNAEENIDWFMDMGDYTYTNYLGDATYANSIDVANKAKEFINQNKGKNFFLMIYFGVPDKAGHLSGENSTDYDNALINSDEGLGIVLDNLQANGINKNVKIILTADHGWNEGTKGHSTNDFNTITLPLVSNDSDLVGIVPSGGKRRQCDVAPTILNYFGMQPNQYQDITDFGCVSLLKN